MKPRAAISDWRSWPHRKAKAIGMLLALVLAVRFVWGWWVGRDLQAILDDLRRRGGPTSLSEIPIPVVPESQNAWYFQTQAAYSMSRTTRMPGNPRNLNYPACPPYSAEWMKLGEACEQANAMAFALARQASQCPTSQMRQGNDLAHCDLLFMSGTTYVEMLARTLADAAIYAQLKGDELEAIDRVVDVLRIARTFQGDDAFFGWQMFSGGWHIQRLACYSAQVIGPGLSLSAGATSRSVTEQRVRQLIDELLDEEPARAALRRGILLDMLTAIDGSTARAKSAWLTRPLADREIGRWKNTWDLLIQASQCNNNAEAQALVARCPQGKGERDEDEVEQPLAGLFGGNTDPPARLPRYSRWFRQFTWTASTASPGSFVLWVHFQTVAERRVTAVSLACQLYRADHGDWPARLDRLVPEYLPAVPADPFYDDGRPLGYLVLKDKLPGGGDRPVVYYDLVYTGQDRPSPHAAVPDGPLYGPMGQRPRIHHDIASFYPSTKAVDHKPEEPDAPRENDK